MADKNSPELLTVCVHMLVQIDQEGLTLPERSLYLGQDEDSTKVSFLPLLPPTSIPPLFLLHSFSLPLITSLILLPFTGLNFIIISSHLLFDPNHCLPSRFSLLSFLHHLFSFAFFSTSLCHPPFLFPLFPPSSLPQSFPPSLLLPSALLTLHSLFFIHPPVFLCHPLWCCCAVHFATCHRRLRTLLTMSQQHLLSISADITLLLRS